MTRLRTLAIAPLLLLLSACVRSTTRYMWGGGFTSEHIDLKPDGTFRYEAWSDSGGTYFIAEGTWKRDKRYLQISTDITEVVMGKEYMESPGCHVPLKMSQRWAETTRGIVRYEVAPVTNARTQTLMHWGQS